jgi:large subunit ribosomal protein L35
LVVFLAALCHKPALAAPGSCGLPWRPLHSRLTGADSGSAGQLPVAKEGRMPKIKTKSGAKKRFKVTAGGKVLYQQSRKRHGMIKRTNKQIRQLRGTNVLFKTDGDTVKKYFLPNG